MRKVHAAHEYAHVGGDGECLEFAHLHQKLGQPFVAEQLAERDATAYADEALMEEMAAEIHSAGRRSAQNQNERGPCRSLEQPIKSALAQARVVEQAA